MLSHLLPRLAFVHLHGHAGASLTGVDAVVQALLAAVRTFVKEMQAGGPVAKGAGASAKAQQPQASSAQQQVRITCIRAISGCSE